MAAKKTPAQLRADAEKLLKKAQEQENRQFVKIGKMVKKLVENNFSNFNVAEFQRECKKILAM